MGTNKQYKGYKAYDYLEAGVDYRSFELCEGDKIFPEYLIPLTKEQEERVEQLARDTICISIHEHPVLFPKHLKREDVYKRQLLESTLEAIEIGEKSGARVQVSHLSVTSPESFDAVLEASNRGVDIAIDTIPRSTGHCTRKDRLIQFIMAISSEFFDLGVEGVKAALHTEEGRKKILEDAYIFGNDMNNVIVINTGTEELENKSIQEIADKRGEEDSREVLLDLLADENDNYTLDVYKRQG